RVSLSPPAASTKARRRDVWRLGFPTGCTGFLISPMPNEQAADRAYGRESRAHLTAPSPSSNHSSHVTDGNRLPRAGPAFLREVTGAFATPRISSTRTTS